MAGANPMRGEAALGEHKLVVDFNGWCVAEAAMGATMNEILSMIARDELGLRGLRTLVRAFLSADMPAETVGNLIGELGIAATSDALNAAFRGFFPKKAKAEDPPKAE